MSQNVIESMDADNRAIGVSKLGDHVKHLLFSEDMSDVEFAVGRDYGAVMVFPAHRVIIGVRSPVFHAMFYGSLPDNCTAPIEIPDVLPHAFANMLSYLYTDVVWDFTQDNVFHTLGCADKYDLPLLVAMCTNFVLSDLNIGNCLDMLDSAVHYANVAPSILEKCLSVIDESAKSIWQSVRFSAIGREALCAILSRDTLTANEDTICLAVDKWAANMCMQRNLDPSFVNRREVLGQALFLIRFPLLTDVQLLDGPVKSGLLLQSEVLDIYHCKHATIKPPLPFPTKPRQNVRAEGVISYTVPDARALPESPACMLSDLVTVKADYRRIEVKKKIYGESTYLGFYLSCSGCPKSTSWTCQATAEMHLMPWKTNCTS
ncbi:BTB/POZ domain-containing protein 1-like [Paramacrobiotus metropolitanus]|uniref:BTB/POZ domain-containing protein 1-like n=1 Tax=Paramacrobiotus metropolitanus TaxID=2943436 RepID=UPI0024465B9A|nr:BTB/POZ domain-containing protein 1-like [Paramacrobiotus metropolitanus]XP_055356822.1 BTB/POZ domain-containing protein 1-like [Paramacrobiotus metropolitanus]